MDRCARTTLNRLANGGILLGLVVAGLPFGMRAYGHWAQSKERRSFAPATTEARAAPAAAAPSETPRGATLSTKPRGRVPRRAWRTSVLQIPSIGVDVLASEGTDRWALTIGPGHIPGSAGPGGRGNCIIGAHRNMWDAAFADLPRVRPGDAVYLTTSTDRYTYIVASSREVTTADRAPLRDTADACLTLITCVLPFDHGRRWVVRARLQP